MFIIDGHEDIATTLFETGRDFALQDHHHSLSLPGLKEGGVGLVLATLFAPDIEGHGGPSADEQFRLYDGLFHSFPDDLRRIGTAGQLEGLRSSGKLGLIFLLEGADPLRDVADLDAFHARGVRVVGLTWNNDNVYAGGVSSGTGLSRKGRELLSAMAQKSMVLDLSHLNDRSFEEVLDSWAGPVVASHSNARAVADHRRNLTDAQIRRIAERDGVIGLNFYRGFLVPPGDGDRRARVEDLLRHATHITGLGGPGCLAIGTDFDGGFGPAGAVEGCERAEELPVLAEALSGAGFSEEEVEGVCWGNWYRVLKRAFPRER